MDMMSPGDRVRIRHWVDDTGPDATHVLGEAGTVLEGCPTHSKVYIVDWGQYRTFYQEDIP